MFNQQIILELGEVIDVLDVMAVVSEFVDDSILDVLINERDGVCRDDHSSGLSTVAVGRLI